MTEADITMAETDATIPEVVVTNFEADAPGNIRTRRASKLFHAPSDVDMA